MREKIEIFEPTMCCPTGLCGASINSEILRVSALVNILEQKDVAIKRYNLTNNPNEFISNKVIHNLIEKEGEKVLPATLVNGELVKKREYPTNQELNKWAGISIEQNKHEKDDSGCCGGRDRCC